MIENILILDTETTGLNPTNGSQVIEVGVVIFNVKYRTILQCFSTLIPCESNPVEEINHIKPEYTKCIYPYKYDYELNYEKIFDDLHSPNTLVIEVNFNFNSILIDMANACQACVAHNASFDMKFIETFPAATKLCSMKWICSKNDFKWPIPLSRYRLEDICKAFNVPYINAHRALYDCLLLAQCFERVHDLDVRINRC